MPAISLKETRVRTWALFDKITAIKKDHRSLNYLRLESEWPTMQFVLLWILI